MEIRLRVWDEDDKKMYFWSENDIGVAEQYLETEHIKFQVASFHYPLEQYIGPDKNGKDVFESDIGQLGDYKCVMTWSDLEAAFRWIDTNTGQWIVGRPSDAEIIGTIHDKALMEKRDANT